MGARRTDKAFTACDYSKSVIATSKGTLLASRWFYACGEIYMKHPHNITVLQKGIAAMCNSICMCYHKYGDLAKQNASSEFKSTLHTCVFTFIEIWTQKLHPDLMFKSHEAWFEMHNRIKARQPLEVELPKTTDVKSLQERRSAPTLDATHHNDAPATVSNNLNVVIDGHDASALVDTGADYSVLSGRLSRRLRKVMTPWDGPQIRTAGGHLITPVGRCTARVEIHGETCPVKFVVLQDCSRDVILGMDFLCEYGAIIDLAENKLTLRKPVPSVENPKPTLAAVRVLASHVNLPPLSSVFVPVGTEGATCGVALLEGSVQLLLGRGIGIARGVTELQDGRTVALVTNFRQESQHLTKGTAVGYVEEIQDSAAIAVISEDASPTQNKTITSSELDIDPSLPAPQRRQLRDLLAEFSQEQRVDIEWQ
ncbi:uncharacterized protein ISCGN_013745 [Ixodes scapularis]